MKYQLATLLFASMALSQSTTTVKEAREICGKNIKLSCCERGGPLQAVFENCKEISTASEYCPVCSVHLTLSI
jgi:hypothetical protein